MAVRKKIGVDVYTAAVARVTALLEEGHRLVVSFSAGKDSCVALEVTIAAARAVGRLPVDVVMRDEEIMYPGSYEYAERVYARKDEVRFHWLVARQPIVNVFNRKAPYYWVFDEALRPEQWVRTFPDYAIHIPQKNIEAMNIPERFPPAPGKQLISVMGLRVQESKGRLFGLFSAGSHLTKPNRHGVRHLWPIYDWTDDDVWKAVLDNKWDYNNAYDTLFRLGMPKRRLRIAPPTLNAASASSLPFAAKAWPKWFGKVCIRLPGVRQVALFGIRAVSPERRLGETWKDTFGRLCLGPDTPDWIKERAVLGRDGYLHAHGRHSTAPFPDVDPCQQCTKDTGSWRNLTRALYGGDPFSLKVQRLSYMEPEFFRKGAGTWDGTPSF